MPWWAYSFGEALRLGDPLQQVAGEVDAATLPDAALQLPADGLGKAHVGVADHQLDASEAALLLLRRSLRLERGKELTPEALAFAVAHLETQQLPAAVGIDAHGDDHGP
jgi:hypothetical protein